MNQFEIPYNINTTTQLNKKILYLKTMTKDDIISKILKLELEVTTRIIKDRNFRANDEDEYKNHRIRLKKLRKKLAKFK